MSAATRRLAGALYGFDAVVRRIPPEAWTAPSPCEGWCVDDVVAHAARVNDFTTGTLLGLDTSARWTAAPDGAGSGPEATVHLWQATLAPLLEALDEPDVLARTVVVPFGTMTADAFLDVAMFDWLAHTWDAATGSGLPACLDDSLCAHALARLEPLESFFRGSGRLGPAVPCPADASATDRFLAHLGRDPRAGVRP
jgi:uncharacterized protein (TIGR03086 family)